MRHLGSDDQLQTIAVPSHRAQMFYLVRVKQAQAVHVSAGISVLVSLFLTSR